MKLWNPFKPCLRWFIWLFVEPPKSRRSSELYKRFIEASGGSFSTVHQALTDAQAAAGYNNALDEEDVVQRIKAIRSQPQVIYRVPTSTRKAVDCSMKNDIHQQLAAELKADRIKAECGKA